MSQLEDSPAGLLRNFEDNLIEEMEDLEGDDIARQLLLVIVAVVHAAASTAEAVERQGEKNESA
jgi:hypothetical protein